MHTSPNYTITSQVSAFLLIFCYFRYSPEGGAFYCFAIGSLYLSLVIYAVLVIMDVIIYVSVKFPCCNLLLQNDKDIQGGQLIERF